MDRGFRRTAARPNVSSELRRRAVRSIFHEELGELRGVARRMRVFANSFSERLCTRSHRFSSGPQRHPHIWWGLCLTPQVAPRRIRATFLVWSSFLALSGGSRYRASLLGEISMQYMPGFTVQCINAMCDLRGHWLRADATGPISDDGRCPCCGDMLRAVPPPLGPRFRMRPRPLTARPPLRPRPR